MIKTWGNYGRNLSLASAMEEAENEVNGWLKLQAKQYAVTHLSTNTTTTRYDDEWWYTMNVTVKLDEK